MASLRSASRNDSVASISRISTDNVMTTDSADLLARYFPDVPLKRPVHGTETLLSIDKARRLLDFQPAHTWRDHV